MTVVVLTHRKGSSQSLVKEVKDWQEGSGGRGRGGAGGRGEAGRGQRGRLGNPGHRKQAGRKLDTTELLLVGKV